MIPFRHRALIRLASLLGIATLAGCAFDLPYTTVQPITDFGEYTQELYVVVTWVTVIVFVMVFALLGWIVVRYRDDGKAGNPTQIHGNTTMEIGWTLIPIFIVLSLIVPTIRTIFILADAPPSGAVDERGKLLVDADGAALKPTVEIKATGKRWWWDFEYTGLGIRTGNQFAFPDDRPVSITITSDTVIHSFWLPRVGGKRDAIPGRLNRIWFSMTKEHDVPAGSIEHVRGECAEYCGEAHSMMRFEALALDGADYDKWVAEYQAGPRIDTAIEAAGKAAFASAGCIGCHTITGNEQANGVQGPELSFFGDRRWLAAGVHDMYPNGPGDEAKARELLTQWITDPNSLKPGTTKTTADGERGNPSRGIDGMNIPVDQNGDGVLQPTEFGPEKIDAIVSYLLAQKSSFPLTSAAKN